MRDEAIGPALDDLPTELIADLHGELRVVASALLTQERSGHTLQPTALVNELWLRLASSDGESQPRFENRAAFLAYASKCIRSILVDHARRRSAAKRGGDNATRVDLTTEQGQLVGGTDGIAGVACSVLELEDELKTLEKLESRCANVFEMRFFGGMTPSQVAEQLGLSVRSVADDFSFARAWLAARLRGDANCDAPTPPKRRRSTPTVGDGE